MVLEQLNDVNVGTVLESLCDARVTYFRRASYLTFLPFASALHAMIASFTTNLSALDSFGRRGHQCSTASKCHGDNARKWSCDETKHNAPFG
jgi:hypothetical protein